MRWRSTSMARWTAARARRRARRRIRPFRRDRAICDETGSSDQSAAQRLDFPGGPALLLAMAPARRREEEGLARRHARATVVAPLYCEPHAALSSPTSSCGRGVAQPGSAHAWGACGRRFKSGHPDQLSPNGFRLLAQSVERQGDAGRAAGTSGIRIPAYTARLGPYDGEKTPMPVPLRIW